MRNQKAALEHYGGVELVRSKFDKCMHSGGSLAAWLAAEHLLPAATLHVATSNKRIHLYLTSTFYRYILAPLFMLHAA
jgi:hypothetical protein